MGYNSKYTGREVEELLDKIKNFSGNNNSNNNVDVDLSQYVTLTKLSEELQKKVDAVKGKGLSTEDFTTALKDKLNSLENCDVAELTNALTILRNDLDNLVSGDTTTAIKTFNDVIAFLEGLSDTEDLSSIIGAIERQIAFKQDNITDLDVIREEANKVPTILGEDGYLYSNGEKIDMRFTRSLLPVGTSIPTNANLNTIEYLRIGKYYCSLTADAKTITNCPVSKAFSMEVFNPLGVNVDDETTANYTYRLRVLTLYDTGQQYIQYCSANGTPGVWTYASWYIVPRAEVTLKSSKNGSTPTVGATTRGIYLDSTGTLKQMSYTVSKSVPSNAIFTDASVTTVANHYAPVADTSFELNATSGRAIAGLQRDAAGHVVGIKTTPISDPVIAWFEVTKLDGDVGDVIFREDRQDVDEMINEFIDAIIHSTATACIWFDDTPRGYAFVSSVWYDNSLPYDLYRFGYIYNGYVYEVELEDGPMTIFTIIGKMKIGGSEGGDSPIEQIAISGDMTSSTFALTASEAAAIVSAYDEGKTIMLKPKGTSYYSTGWIVPTILKQTMATQRRLYISYYIGGVYGEVTATYDVSANTITMNNVYIADTKGINNNIVEITDATSINLAPGKAHIITNIPSSVTVNSFVEPTTSVAEYSLHFFTGSSVGAFRLPVEAFFANGVVPTLEPSTAYELSVVATLFNGAYIYKAVLTAFKQG